MAILQAPFSMLTRSPVKIPDAIGSGLTPTVPIAVGPACASEGGQVSMPILRSAGWPQLLAKEP
jgi:hypothetical protein